MILGHCFRIVLIISVVAVGGAIVGSVEAQVIDFETLPGGGVPTDNQPLDPNTPYLVEGIEVRIGFDADRDGVVETHGVFEAVGRDGSDGFQNSGANGFDVADPIFEDQLGLWFLRSVNSIGADPGILVLEYSEPVASMSGEIWDIDGFGGTEAWLVRAKDATGAVVATIRSPEISNQGSSSLDGEPWIFALHEPAGFVRVEIEFDGTKSNNIGLAFNNYSATNSLPGPNLLAYTPNTPNGVFRSPGGTDVIRLVWNEAVSLDESDIEILDVFGSSVSFSLSGSQTQVIDILLDELFVEDTYTITVFDTAVAAVNNAPIDGDDDGVAGGDKVFQLQHTVCSADFDGDGDVDMSDFNMFALWFSGPLP